MTAKIVAESMLQRVTLFAIVASLTACATQPVTNTNGKGISNIHSVIDIQEDGGLKIEKSLSIISENKHRKFWTNVKTYRKCSDGSRLQAPVKNLRGERDGLEDAHQIKNVLAAKKITIGKNDADLIPGQYTYTITYELDSGVSNTDQGLVFHRNISESWSKVPVNSVTSEIRIPKNIEVLEAYAQIRRMGGNRNKGGKGKKYNYTIKPDGTLYVETTQALKLGDSLFAVIVFPKGSISTQDVCEGIPL